MQLALMIDPHYTQISDTLKKYDAAIVETIETKIEQLLSVISVAGDVDMTAGDNAKKSIRAMLVTMVQFAPEKVFGMEKVEIRHIEGSEVVKFEGTTLIVDAMVFHQGVSAVAQLGEVAPAALARNVKMSSNGNLDKTAAVPVGDIIKQVEKMALPGDGIFKLYKADDGVIYLTNGKQDKIVIITKNEKNYHAAFKEGVLVSDMIQGTEEIPAGDWSSSLTGVAVAGFDGGIRTLDPLEQSPLRASAAVAGPNDAGSNNNKAQDKNNIDMQANVMSAMGLFGSTNLIEYLRNMSPWGLSPPVVATMFIFAAATILGYVLIKKFSQNTFGAVVTMVMRIIHQKTQAARDAIINSAIYRSARVYAEKAASYSTIIIADIKQLLGYPTVAGAGRGVIYDGGLESEASINLIVLPSDEATYRGRLDDSSRTAFNYGLRSIQPTVAGWMNSLSAASIWIQKGGYALAQQLEAFPSVAGRLPKNWLVAGAPALNNISDKVSGSLASMSTWAGSLAGLMTKNLKMGALCQELQNTSRRLTPLAYKVLILQKIGGVSWLTSQRDRASRLNILLSSTTRARSSLQGASSSELNILSGSTFLTKTQEMSLPATEELKLGRSYLTNLSASIYRTMSTALSTTAIFPSTRSAASLTREAGAADGGNLDIEKVLNNLQHKIIFLAFIGHSASGKTATMVEMARRYPAVFAIPQKITNRPARPKKDTEKNIVLSVTSEQLLEEIALGRIIFFRSEDVEKAFQPESRDVALYGLRKSDVIELRESKVLMVDTSSFDKIDILTKDLRKVFLGKEIVVIKVVLSRFPVDVSADRVRVVLASERNAAGADLESRVKKTMACLAEIKENQPELFFPHEGIIPFDRIDDQDSAELNNLDGGRAVPAAVMIVSVLMAITSLAVLPAIAGVFAASIVAFLGWTAFVAGAYSFWKKSSIMYTGKISDGRILAIEKVFSLLLVRAKDNEQVSAAMEKYMPWQTNAKKNFWSKRGLVFNIAVAAAFAVITLVFPVVSPIFAGVVGFIFMYLLFVTVNFFFNWVQSDIGFANFVKDFDNLDQALQSAITEDKVDIGGLTKYYEDQLIDNKNVLKMLKAKFDLKARIYAPVLHATVRFALGRGLLALIALIVAGPIVGLLPQWVAVLPFNSGIQAYMVSVEIALFNIPFEVASAIVQMFTLSNLIRVFLITFALSFAKAPGFFNIERSKAVYQADETFQKASESYGAFANNKENLELIALGFFNKAGFTPEELESLRALIVTPTPKSVYVLTLGLLLTAWIRKGYRLDFWTSYAHMWLISGEITTVIAMGNLVG
ncbi:MAG: hypothetical protein WCY10_04875, partial [Candidatus Omnitrophota bacterium]